MHAERTVVVARPVDVVFEYVASGRLTAQWREGVREIALMTNSAEQGAVYRQVITGPAGHDVDCDYLITRYDPPHRLEFAVVAGPARPIGSFELTERDGHTQVTFCLDAAPRALRRLLAPLWSRFLRAEVAQLDRFNTVLESEPSVV
jgi:uncharacterized protein YndB with AHSA1/START domain